MVMDNLNIHCRKSLTNYFGAEYGGKIGDRLTVHYTPKHGSWFNQAEIEIGLLLASASATEGSAVSTPSGVSQRRIAVERIEIGCRFNGTNQLPHVCRWQWETLAPGIVLALTRLDNRGIDDLWIQTSCCPARWR